MPAVDDWNAALRFNVTLGLAKWRVELGETSAVPYKFSTPGLCGTQRAQGGAAAAWT